MDAGVGANRNKAWSFTSVPSVSQQEQETAYYTPWSHNACYNPCELLRGFQDSIVKRFREKCL